MVIFDDGFESGDFSMWTGPSQGGPEVVTTPYPIYAGTYSARFRNTNNNLEYVTEPMSLSGNVVYIQGYIYWRTVIDTPDLDGQWCGCFGILGADIGIFFGLWRKNVNEHTLALEVTGTGFTSQRIDLEIPLAKEKWYRVQIEFYRSASGWVKIWINGELEDTVSGDFSGMIPPYWFFVGYWGYKGGTEIFEVFADDCSYDESYISSCPPSGIKLKDFIFEHILDYDEKMSRPIPRKGVLGKCSPTPEATSFTTEARIITIRARVNSSEKAELWNLHKECSWQYLCVDGIIEDDVWLERPTFKWDSELGCGPNSRSWVVTLKLICRYS